MLSINTSSTLLEDVKKEIRCILISKGSNDITLSKLNYTYKQVLDIDIPFKDFNYTSLKDFLSSMPDAVQLKYNKNNELCVYHIDIEKSKHISYLVSKNKKKAHTKKSTLKHNYNNYLDPYILNDILQDYISQSIYKNKISKMDILSKVTKHIGSYSFYTMENLNNQLYELNHLLTYDENYIYFKKTLSLDNNKKAKEQGLILDKSKIRNSIHQINKNTNKKISTINLVGNLIKDTTKFRLQKLIEKHSNGIWCTELPRIYCYEYGIELEYKNLGFNSIIEFVNALPDIVQIIKVPNIVRLLIVSAKTSANDIKELKIKIKIFQALKSHKMIENEELNAEAIPTKLVLKSYFVFIPNNVQKIFYFI
jgi:hypothetical protein